MEILSSEEFITNIRTQIEAAYRERFNYWMGIRFETSERLMGSSPWLRGHEVAGRILSYLIER